MALLAEQQRNDKTQKDIISNRVQGSDAQEIVASVVESILTRLHQTEIARKQWQLSWREIPY